MEKSHAHLSLEEYYFGNKMPKCGSDKVGAPPPPTTHSSKTLHSLP